MKKTIFKLASIFVIVFALTLCQLSIFKDSDNNVVASEVDNPQIEIYKNNVSYSSEVYIMYAVSCEGFDASNYSVKMLIWNELQTEYLKGTEKYCLTDKGYRIIDEKYCLVFASHGLAAKNMTDDIYARGYVVINEQEYYTDVVKFSVLEYVNKMKEESTLTPSQRNLFDSMLGYGGAAQNNFDYNTDRLANGEYYGIKVHNGHCPDGFNHGRYQYGEKVVIKANEHENGHKFSHWTDENGIIVSYDKEFELDIHSKKEYTAHYKDVSNVSAQLKMSMDVTYDATADELDLADAVEFEYGNAKVQLDVVWDTTSFVEKQVGTQKLYATLKDETAYATYGINENDIYVEINTLPYTYEVDQVTGEYILTGYYGDDEVVVIPTLYNNTYITKIASKAFNEVSTLKEVVIPESIKEIELSAFYFCDNIEKMTIPFIGRSTSDYQNHGFSHLAYIFGATSYEIQEAMLPLNLKSITLNEAVTHIGDYAFYDCSQLEEINISDSLEYIGQFSFENCTGLTEFYIGENFKTIANESFIGCTNLKKVYACNLETLFSINIQGASSGGGYYSPLSNGAELYIDDTLVTEITIPSTIDYLYGILTGCSSIEKVVIPNSITGMYWGCFANMENLKEVEFEENSKLTELAPGTFYGCSSLEAIELPESITTIGSDVFSQCTSLVSIDISSINNVYESDRMFSNCISLESVILSNDLIYIPNNAFYGCSSLKEINLPDGITSIGMSAFFGCISLQSIELPVRLRTIESDAFNGCINLYFVINNSSLELSLGSSENGYVVYYAKQITDANGDIINNEGYSYEITDDNLIFECYDGEYTLIAYLGDEDTITLPLTINDTDYKIHQFNGAKNVIIPEGITTIDEYAFRNSSMLKSITIPSTVSSIEQYAFAGTTCEIIWENTTIEEIGSYAFAQYHGTSLTIPSTVTSIGEYAFEYSTCEIIWKDSTIEEIGSYAFAQYQGTSLTIPDSVKTIKSYAFNGCSNLTSMVIPDNVLSIEEFTFGACYSLTNVTIGNSVTSIGYFAFNYCSSLTNITIGNSVTSIGYYAFNCCENLISIVIPDSVISVEYNIFDGCEKLTIYCEAESQPEGWSVDWNYSNRPVVWEYIIEE